MKRIAAAAGLLAIGMAITACSSTPEVEASPTPEPSATAEAIEEATPAGTRENPIPFGQSYTFEDLGEEGGPAWTVTIDEPRDMGPEILAAAVEAYGDDDESYLASSRPEPGTLFLGYTGTVERLMDFPSTPGADLETALIGDDGNTYNALLLGMSFPEESISNIAEMYAPATARFADVQSVPEGVSAAQVLITMRNTGERIYFGNAAVTDSPVANGGVGLDAMKEDWATTASESSKQEIRDAWASARETDQSYNFVSLMTDQFNANGFQVTVDEVEEFLDWALEN